MTESAPPIQSDKFWFKDGDMVLSVKEDGVETHFRIHRAILTMSSPVFRDMFSIPQPPEHETLPVPLEGDSLHDVKALLGALYYSRELHPQLPFDMILGILRLSHKYLMEELQKKMRQKLANDWPITFSHFMARLSIIGPSPVYRVSQALALIETAQRCEANELLPAAFYEVACAWGTRWEEIIGVMSPDNVIRLSIGRARSERRLRAVQDINSDPMWQPVLSSWTRTIFHHRKNFRKCSKHPFSVSYYSYCSTIIPAFRSKVALLLLDGIFAIPAIQQCNRADLSGGCKPCKDWFMDVLKDRIEELWNKIPTYFNLA